MLSYFNKRRCHMEKVWSLLYKEAKSKLSAKEVSVFFTLGNTACAILGSNNKIYAGSNISSNSIISCSAEKSAVIEMFNDGEYVIDKMVLLNELEEVILPSDGSLEYLLELNPEFGNIDILVDYEKEKVIKLRQLIPKWWGTYRNFK